MTVAARAFSIIETLVVVLIIAVLAMAVVPRLASLTALRVKPVADQAADVLSAAARRDQLTSQRVAIDFDSDDGRLRMLVLRPTDDARGMEWAEDALSPQVRLGQVQVVAARADTVDLDPARWRVEFFGASRRRQQVVLLLSGPGGRDPWTVSLSPDMAQAEVRPGWSQRQIEGAALELDEQEAW